MQGQNSAKGCIHSSKLLLNYIIHLTKKFVGMSTELVNWCVFIYIILYMLYATYINFNIGNTLIS
jgi:hypothetical protein